MSLILSIANIKLDHQTTLGAVQITQYLHSNALYQFQACELRQYQQASLDGFGLYYYGHLLQRSENQLWYMGARTN